MAAIHILFGDSAARNFKAAYNIYNEQLTEKQPTCQPFIDHATLLNCIDRFAIGPVFEMDIPTGFFDRINWIGEFLDEMIEPGMSYDDVDACLERISDFYKKLSWIENDQEVVIWHGHNVVERIGSCMVSSLLPDCKLYEVDLHELKYQELKNLSTKRIGECPPEELAKLFEHITPVSDLKRAFWDNEWQTLVQEKGNLRIWAAGGVHAVKSDYFDEDLMTHCETVPVLAVKLVEKILENPQCEAGADFLNMRLRKLIEKGELNYIGTTDALVNFSVYKK